MKKKKRQKYHFPANHHVCGINRGYAQVQKHNTPSLSLLITIIFCGFSPFFFFLLLLLSTGKRGEKRTDRERETKTRLKHAEVPKEKKKKRGEAIYGDGIPKHETV